MVLAYIFASGLGFGIGRFLDQGRLLRSIPREHPLHRVLATMKEREWVLMVLLRVSPVLPFSLINVIIPATGIRFRVFVVAGFIGMLPRTIFGSFTGWLIILQPPDVFLNTSNQDRCTHKLCT